MLVKELIEELKKFPEDADIIVTSEKYRGYYVISSVEHMRTINTEKNDAEIICPVLRTFWIYGGVLVLITLYLVVPYAVDVQPTLKKHKPINANKVRKSVRSLVDYIKSAMQAPAISFAIAA